WTPATTSHRGLRTTPEAGGRSTARPPWPTLEPRSRRRPRSVRSRSSVGRRRGSPDSQLGYEPVGKRDAENRATSIHDFARYSQVLHDLPADCARAVPDDKGDFTPDRPGKPGRSPAPHRIGDGFAPFCKQLRHVVCVRGVYNAALATRK